ncbi:GTP cyclohydrolase I FolE [Oenococcus sp. UCMA 17063]|nr:GTP cyclohydrolase I FolE [Oenococcus sp. UCMA 17063]
MENVFLSLGSNLGNRQLNLQRAIKYLGQNENILIEAASSYYETSPVGNLNQANFLNIAVKICTKLSPQELLLYIHQIETKLKRTREIHWGPRTLDIDIIFFGQQTISDSKLIIPHPETFKRLFVLEPILEICDPNLIYYQEIKENIKKLKNGKQEIKIVKKEEFGQQKIEQAVKQLLEAIGEDPKRPGLTETPARVARMYQEIFSTQGLDEFTDYKIFKIPETDNPQMILIKDIPFNSICEHHLLPFFGKISLAYIPKDGKIIGLSKIPRLVDFVSHRLNIQEKMTANIAETFKEILQPKGVAVLTSARHMCMEMRGIKKIGETTQMTYFSGLFNSQPQLQTQFLKMLEQK